MRLVYEKLKAQLLLITLLSVLEYLFYILKKYMIYVPLDKCDKLKKKRTESKMLIDYLM